MADSEILLGWDGGVQHTPPRTLRELEDHIDQRIRLRLAEYAADETRHMNARFDELKRLLTSAFPGGDPDEHRRYHDEVIGWMRERRALWVSIREKTLTALLWALLVGLGAAIWGTVKAKLGVSL